MDFSLIVNLLSSASIIASLLVLIIFIIKTVLRHRMSARWHYVIWFVLILRLAVPYAVYSPFNISGIYKTADITSPANQGITTKDAPMSASTSDLHSKTNDNASGIGYSNQQAGKTAKKSLLPIDSVKKLLHSISTIKVSSKTAFFVWLSGILFLSVYYFLYSIFFWTKVKNGSIFTDQRIIKLLEESKNTLGIRTNVSIIQTSGVMIPAIFGVTRPWLLLPEKVLKNMEHESLRYVLLHELGHLKRKDIVVNWIALVLQIVYWFNPVIWIAFHRMRIDRELACDETVLMHLESAEAKKYGYTILDMVEIISGKLNFAGTAGILENRSQIKDRISAISLFHAKNTKVSIRSIVILVILGGSIFVNASSLPQNTSSRFKKSSDISALTSADKKENSKTEQNQNSNKIENNTNSTVIQTKSVSGTSIDVQDKEQTKASNQMNKKGPQSDKNSILKVPSEDASKHLLQGSDTLTDGKSSKITKTASPQMSELIPAGGWNQETCERMEDPISGIKENKDCIIITKISPDKNLQEGVETKITVEIEYNLVSEDFGELMFFSNIGRREGSTSRDGDAISSWDITKGKGKYRLQMSVIPKHWEDGSPFWIDINLARLNKTSIRTSAKYYLGLKGYTDSAASIIRLKIASGITVEKVGDGNWAFCIETSDLPAGMGNPAKLSTICSDEMSDYDIPFFVSDVKQGRIGVMDYDDNSISNITFAQKYAALLLFDENMNLLGYYIYEKPD